MKKQWQKGIIALSLFFTPMVMFGSTPNLPIEPIIGFVVKAPTYIPSEYRVRETFPIRNYIFFDLGSTRIPKRYVLLKKSQVKDFKEDQLEVFTPKRLSDRSKRQMIAYYNILNILGDRMSKNPSSEINLVGSSEKGATDGKAMAESVKNYLVEVFGINESRIITEGNTKPKIPSLQPGGTDEIRLLKEGERRVTIESKTPALLMEFQSGPNAPLKPVMITYLQDTPPDANISFTVDGETGALASWSLEIRDEVGTLKRFGPFKKDNISISGKSVLGKRTEGNFKVKMIGQLKTNGVIQRDTNIFIALFTPAQNEEGMRFTVLFEFNESTSIKIYDQYLSEIVTPKIPKGGKVIIQGYTDIIGDEFSNQKLAQARANDVKNTIETALLKSGRSDVRFEVNGFGENEALMPFQNKYPEERFYNRTVIIDIVANKK